MRTYHLQINFSFASLIFMLNVFSQSGCLVSGHLLFLLHNPLRHSAQLHPNQTLPSMKPDR